MRLKIPALAVLAALAPALADAHEVTVKGVTVAHPWARATPEGAKVRPAFPEIQKGQEHIQPPGRRPYCRIGSPHSLGRSYLGLRPAPFAWRQWPHRMPGP